MKQNNRPEEIGKRLLAARDVLLFPHILVDGDGLGASAALCEGLRNAGVSARIVTEDKIPDYLAFLDRGLSVPIEEIPEDYEPEVTVLLDCSGESRLPKRFPLFRKGKVKMCIDHHETAGTPGDYNYIFPKQAATGELVFDILQAAKIPITQTMAAALFAAITTDTGNYQYNNTTARSHEITVELYKLGLDSYPVSRELYENTPFCKIKLFSKGMDRLELFAGGEGAITAVTQEMLKECGARMEDSEGLVSDVRGIAGVQIAAVVKEQEDGSVKVSMRSKDRGNVAELSSRFGGGGHEKAAGCTFPDKGVGEVTALLKEAITEHLREA